MSIPAAGQARRSAPSQGIPRDLAVDVLVLARCGECRSSVPLDLHVVS